MLLKEDTMSKPTIKELEAILDAETPGKTRLMPDGSVEIETDTETIARLQSSLTAKDKELKDLIHDMERLMNAASYEATRAGKMERDLTAALEQEKVLESAVEFGLTGINMVLTDGNLNEAQKHNLLTMEKRLKKALKGEGK